MQKSEVRIGGLYHAKVSGDRVIVKVLSEHPIKGWYAENLKTGRSIHVKTAARLWRPA